MFPQPCQLCLIDRGQNASRAYRMRPAAGVLPKAFHRVAGKELLKFSRKSHGKRCNEARDTQGTADAASAQTWGPTTTPSPFFSTRTGRHDPLRRPKLSSRHYTALQK